MDGYILLASFAVEDRFLELFCVLEPTRCQMETVEGCSIPLVVGWSDGEW